MGNTRTVQIISRLLVFIASTVVSSAPSVSQWLQQQVPGDATMLLSIDFTDSLHGAAGGHVQGQIGRIVFTTDGGQNWLRSNVPDSARSIVSVNFVGSGTAFALGAYNLSATSARPNKRPFAHLAYGYERYLRTLGIDGTGSYRGYELKTTDGGQNWFPYGKLPEGVTFVTGATFVNPLIGYATGDTAESFGGACVFKTTNGAMTWSRLPIPDSIVSLRDIRFTDSLSGVAVGYSAAGEAGRGIIIRTTDGGTTWLQTSFPSVDNFVSVSFANAFIGYASGPSNVDSTHGVRGLVYKTTDRGASWAEVPFVGADSVFENHVKFAWGTDVGIVYGIHASPGLDGDRPFVARTTDGAASWVIQVLTGLLPEIILVGGTMLDPFNGYISGGDFLSSAVILHTGNGGVADVSRDNDTMLRQYRLEQNYPNPFNPTTTIRYTIAGVVAPSGASLSGVEGRVNNVRLVVYDILGREVATLVNEEKEPGTYTVQFDGAGLSSGVYFCRLDAGSFAQTRKLVLVR